MYSDAFFVAFRLPNIFRSMFAEGAFNASFVPIFAKIDEVKKAQSFAQNVFSLMLLALLVMTILAELFMPALVWALASGFAEDANKFNLSVALSRITFFYLIFIALSSVCGAILNSLNKFIIGALAPTILNITMILTITFFAETQEISAYACAWGVFTAGILQMAFLYYYCRKAGFGNLIKKPEFNAETRKFFRRMFPVLLGAGVLQINILINTQIASNISNGAVSFLYYADRLSQLPLALIGTAMGVVLLPNLSKFLRNGDVERSIATQNTAFWVCMFLAMPAAIGLAMLAPEIVKVLFEHGNFTATDSNQVVGALIPFAIAVPAFVLNKIFTPSFYAAEDTRTPVNISIFCILFNVALSLFLIHQFHMNHVGLAISTAASAYVNVIALNILMYKKSLFHYQRTAIIKLLQVLFCSAIMAATILLCKQQQFSESLTVSLFATIIIGAVVYFGCALLLKIVSIRTMLKRV